MSFAGNWLEELISEWLQIEGFFVEINPPIQLSKDDREILGIEGKGGRGEPDIVGARINNGVLTIRHCEAATHLVGDPSDTAKTYVKKFSEPIQRKVRDEFYGVLGINEERDYSYERWIVVGTISRPMKAKIEGEIHGVKILKIQEFITSRVLPAISNWKQRVTAKGNPPALPQDKWLLQMLDWLPPLQI